MSLLKSNSVQIGQSATATQNFTLSVPASPDGTIKLARGNSGATTADILTVDASGNVTTTLASGSVKFSQLSTSATEADNVAKRTAKAWVYFDASGTITNDFNVTSVTANHGGTAGRFLITFTANITNPVVLYTATNVTPGTQYCHQFVESVSSSSVVVINVTDIDGRAAPSINCIAIFGDA